MKVEQIKIINNTLVLNNKIILNIKDIERIEQVQNRLYFDFIEAVFEDFESATDLFFKLINKKKEIK